jgi:integrase/recombinase XerD
MWEREPLEQPELKELIDAAEQRETRDEFIIRTLAHTGLRVGEFVELRSSWIEWQRDLMRVPKREGDWTPKTESAARTIPLKEPDTRRVIRNWFGVHDRVQMHRSTVFRRVKNVAEETSIQKKVTPHVLRHTYGTLLASRGATTQYIKQTMGHATIQSSEQYLQYSGTQLLDEADDVW